MTPQIPEPIKMAILDFMDAVVRTQYENTPPDEVPADIAECMAALVAAIFVPHMLRIDVTAREQIACALELAKRYTAQPRITEDGRRTGIRMVEMMREHVINVAMHRIAELTNEQTHH